jgi:hypothetical protein
VHKIGGRLSVTFGEDPVGGIDWERGWQWHCLAESCENYSLVMLVPKEWLTDGP